MAAICGHQVYGVCLRQEAQGRRSVWTDTGDRPQNVTQMLGHVREAIGASKSNSTGKRGFEVIEHGENASKSNSTGEETSKSNSTHGLTTSDGP